MSRFLTRGHPAATRAVSAMIAGTTPHAIVMAGPAGVGKTTLALDLAAGLMCTAADRADRPCRDCRGCRLVERGAHADLHRLAPSGAGNQIRIGDRREPEPGTIRRLIADLALLPVEGGARVVIVEAAERLNEDAQSALLKTLEEPSSAVVIVLCVEREDQLLPTVRSRSARLRLGPVAVRDIEAILADQGVADAPTAARLARLATGRPGVARAWALAPEAVIGRSEIARSLLDLRSAGAAQRLAAGRELVSRAGDVIKALAVADRQPRDVPPTARRGRKGVAKGAVTAVEASLPVSAEPAAAADGVTEDQDLEQGDARDTRTPASERRRAAALVITIWRDVARDLALVRLGEERRLRDPALLDDFRAAAAALADADLAAFIARLDATAELLDNNVSPELAVDALVLAAPAASRAA
jgi:DNA polymerase-3 subunit delta'